MGADGAWGMEDYGVWEWEMMVDGAWGWGMMVHGGWRMIGHGAFCCYKTNSQLFFKKIVPKVAHF
jgi:hypothetical protein